ncbi:MAG TPA: YDG domain-containing protein [Syntrophales bacterium]|nr:YDG domain-containing protein [Syntrophales bacterium]
MKASRCRKRRIFPIANKLVFVITLIFLSAGNVFALPAGQQVVNGQASFNAQGNNLTITNSPNSIINWQGFSINNNEAVRFIQQCGSSSVLNRVIGQDPSRILGLLQSNGRVFLINPNGMLFGQGARIDVNGFFASTLNIGNQDFLAGKYNFTAGAIAGPIQNQGTITTPGGGKVYLIAPDIENSGIINSPQGDVILAAGHSVQLVDSLDPDISIVLSAPENKAVNLGQIIAQSGKVGIYGGLISQQGIVNADSAVVGENGRIFFKASKNATLDAGSATSANGPQGGQIKIQSESGTTLVSGTVTAAGNDGKGGDIRILGNHVGLIDNARIDVSGKSGGGAVLVGGDYQGKNPAVQNAEATYMGEDTTIEADALDNGNGGKVILWSNDATRAYGGIFAQGGANGGDGGFVEASGKGWLDFNAKVDTQASRGEAGTLLLDPPSIDILAGPGDGGGTAGHSNTTFTGYPNVAPGSVLLFDSDPTTIYQSQIEGQSSSTNIILAASGGISAIGPFSSPVTLANNRDLTLQTRNDSDESDAATGINISAAEFKTQGTGSITIETGVLDAISPQAAPISVGKLTAGGGTITINSSGDININQSVATTTGALDLRAAGDLNVAGTVNVNKFTLSGGKWSQVSASLPGFTANDFSITGGTFIRALGGEGVDAPYQLTDIYGVQGMGSEGMLGNKYVLANNIIATGTSNWNAGEGFVPVGSFCDGCVSEGGFGGGSLPFTGLFDGLGRTITGLHIDSPNSYAGLFGYNSGVVRNVGLVDVTITGQSNVGGLAGYNGATISNSYSTGTVTGNGNYVGGLVGYNYSDTISDATIDNSYSTGAVSGTEDVGGLVGGNIAGINGNGSAVITNSYSTSTVTLNDGNNVGGLVGYNDGNINSSYSTFVGSLVGFDGSAGGIDIFSRIVNSSQMKTPGTFNDWDIADAGGSSAVWRIYAGETYPLLRMFLTPATVTANNGSKTYDSTAYSGGNGKTCSSGACDPAKYMGTVSYGGASQGAINAGSYTITPSGYYSHQQGYDIVFADGALTINPYAVSMTGGRVYDGTANVAAGIFTLGTLVGSETLTLTGAGTVANKNVGTAKTVTLGSLALGNGTNGGLAANYTFTGGTQTADITQAPLTLSTTSVTKAYDGGLTAAGTAAVTSGTLFSGDMLSGGTFAFTDKNVGIGNKTVTATGVTVNDGNSGGNYNVSYADNTTGTINPYAVSMTGSRVYDGMADVTAGIFTLGTLVGSETLTLTGAGTVVNKNVDTAKTVTLGSLTLGNGTNGGLAANYTFTGGTQTADITQAPLMLSTTSVTKTYDGGLTAAGTAAVTSGTLFSGDTLSGGTFAFTDKNVGIGNKTVTATGVTVNDGNSGGNYNVSYADNTTGTINPYAVSMTGSRAYDGTANVAAGIFTLGTLVGSETLTLTGAGTVANKNVGTAKTVTLGSLALGNGTNGGLAANYTFTGGTQTADITRAPLTLSTTSVTKTYDGGLTAAGTTVVTSGTLFTGAGDTLSGGAFAFVGKNVGINNKTVTVTGVTVNDGNGGGNYNVSYANNTTSTINPYAVSLTGSRTYDGTVNVAAGAMTIGTLVGAETLTLAGTGTVANKNVATGKTVNVSGLSLGNRAGLASNYTFTGGTQTVDITARGLTVTATGVNKVYDGLTGATVTLADNRVAGDMLTTAYANAAYLDKNAAAGKTVNVSGITLTNTDAGNYTFNTTAATTADITARGLTVTATGVNKIYDGLTGATVTLADNRVAGDILTTAYASAAYLDKNAAAGKTVNVGGITLTNTDAGNYTFNTTAATMADITARGLIITAAANTKTYDGGITAAAAPTVSGIQGGTDTVSGLAEVYSDKNAATGKTLNVSAYTVNDDNGGNNYTVTTLAAADGVISKAPLTIAAAANTKTYDGGITAAAAPTVSGIQGGADTVSGLAEVYSDKNAATGKTLNVSAYTVNDDNGGNNYTVTTLAAANGVISKAPLTITAAANTKGYDRTTSAAATPSITSGSLAGDDTATLTEVYDSKIAGTGKTLKPEAVIADGNGGNNYQVTLVDDTTGVIAPGQIVSGMLDVAAGGKTIDFVVDGALFPDQAATDASGNYSVMFPLNSIPNNSALLAYVANDGSVKSASVYLSTGEDITNLLLSSSTVTASSGGGTMSNATLGDAKRTFASSDVPYSVSGTDLTLSPNFDFRTASGTTYAVNGNITTTNGAHYYDGPVILQGNAVISAGMGNIIFDGPVTGRGYNLTLDAGAAHDITLMNAGNDFSSVGITSGKDVSLRDAGALALNSSTVSRSLNAKAGGDITLNGLVTAGTGVTLNSGGAIINGMGSARSITAGSLDAEAVNGIGSGDPLMTGLNNLTALNTATNNIEIDNAGVLAVSGMRNLGTGNVILQNIGAITSGLATITASGGKVSIIAHSPLTIGSGGVYADGDISLEASPGSGADDLTIDGNLVSANGNISLKAGRSIVFGTGIGWSTPNGSIRLNDASPDASSNETATANTISSIMTAMGKIESSEKGEDEDERKKKTRESGEQTTDDKKTDDVKNYCN